MKNTQEVKSQKKIRVLTGGVVLEVPKSELSPIQSSITCGPGEFPDLPDPNDCDPFGCPEPTLPPY